ncbi:hypothetical protein KKD19_01350 [Patescibacteria group bacterium]|nr:hypothetical protein [Patescibacteria group bacterium]MBU4511878.1 hypothetical protein [Patescibacteria group bacterium]
MEKPFSAEGPSMEKAEQTSFEGELIRSIKKKRHEKAAEEFGKLRKQVAEVMGGEEEVKRHKRKKALADRFSVGEIVRRRR